LLNDSEPLKRRLKDGSAALVEDEPNGKVVKITEVSRIASIASASTQGSVRQNRLCNNRDYWLDTREKVMAFNAVKSRII
jgi:hypothetical protein